ncbi:MAG: diphthine synthase [Nanoarchaeota archaeon]|nr:diphthine synthase [Nanoarchaeota archaeon]
MLHIIGIGTKKEHITQEMIEVIQQSKHVYIEHYTNFYQHSFEELEEYLSTTITPCVREDIESRVEELILKPAKDEHITLLIIGDILVATTHTDLLLRAKEMNVQTKLYHNISIANLITKTGLQWYKFGKVTSIPFFNEKFMPRTPYLQLYDNMTIGAHSLFLLDLNPSNDIAYKGHDKYLPAHRALQFLLDISQIMLDNEEIEEKEANIIDEQTPALICSRLGMDDEQIWYATIEKLIEKDSKKTLKEPLCIIIPSEMHELEEEYIKLFQI